MNTKMITLCLEHSINLLKKTVDSRFKTQLKNAEDLKKSKYMNLDIPTQVIVSTEYEWIKTH